jgi:tRNA-dihydrouridine synthase C
MLMIGRGAVVDPGLGLAIKADMKGPTGNTQPGTVTWAQLLPLVLDFWHIVTTRLDNKAQAGRLKQWLNFLRRRFPEAEVAYQALKTINSPAVVDDWLNRQTTS